MQLSERYSLVASGDATIRSSQSMYLGAGPQFVVGGQTIFNARVGLQSSDNWSLFLFGRNLGDKVYPSGVFPTIAFYPGGLWHTINANSRRVVGLQFSADF